MTAQVDTNRRRRGTMTDTETQGGELLREAAMLMRERAEAATPGPWEIGGDHAGRPSHIWSERHHCRAGHGEEYPAAECDEAGFLCGDRQPDLEHVALWHPAVALAVADWLDLAAVNAEQWPGVAEDSPAFAVARAYLGRDT